LTRLTQLQNQGLAPQAIQSTLEHDYPLLDGLKTASPLFKALPGRYQIVRWFSLQALQLQPSAPLPNALKPIGNFTLFSDAHFDTLRQAYLTWENSQRQEDQQRFFQALQQAYQPLAGHVYQEAHGKQLHYPTFGQLKIERLYVTYPWI